MRSWIFFENEHKHLLHDLLGPCFFAIPHDVICTKTYKLVSIVEKWPFNLFCGICKRIVDFSHIFVFRRVLGACNSLFDSLEGPWRSDRWVEVIPRRG